MKIESNCALKKMRNVPCGPLPLRSSGICPDAHAQGLRTAHQIACSPDAQSGLKRPLPLRSSGVCPDANAQGLPTAHQIACSPDAQSGLNKITKSHIRKSTSWR